MDEITDQGSQELLKSTVVSLESEFRAFRRAAEHYCATADRGLQAAIDLLHARAAHAEASAGEQAEAVPYRTAPRMRLTNRETQILKLIATGHSTKQAAFLLGIRFKTAAGHRSQLMKKLRIHDTASLVRFAIRTGLVEA